MPTLSEAESMHLLGVFGVPVVPHRLVADPEDPSPAAVTALAHLWRNACWRRRRGL